jgi:small-conductance mechanosensitive channel
MEILDKFYQGVISLIPSAVVIVLAVLVIYVVRLLFSRKYSEIPGRRFRTQLAILILSFAGLLAVILTLPIGDTRQGQLLSLLGILLSAAIAFSSTTFIGNVMAGMMMRAVRNFKTGDFIRVGDRFGRVSERGLFHIEIQTEDRNLTTLPNLYLVTNPVKVIRSSGTIISGEVTLGYDVPRTTIKELLMQAASDAQLRDAFVHVLKLGDFSVTYRVAGLLVDVKQLLTVRSRLHEMMLDALHENNIEVVSPTFMNTRALAKDDDFIPRLSTTAVQKDAVPAKAVPEDLVFDKAEEAESIEKLRERYEALGKKIETSRQLLKEAQDGDEVENLNAKIDNLELSRKKLTEIIKKREEEKDKE